ncbi:MAG: hypothetical protein ABIP71_13265, partial [Verrucomicrobiota bacterium]
MKSRFKFYGSWQILLTLTLCAILPSTDAEEKTAASFAQFDRSARAGKSQTVVFFGGALAAGKGASDPKVTSYRALMEAHLKLNYPAAQFTFHEAAFAGTGSKF